jgi:uncharacterized protein (DUF1501 family)
MKSVAPHLVSTRRQFMLWGGAAAFGAFIPVVSSAAGATDPRFITIVLRGALDGLSAVPPVGDPDYMQIRGAQLQALGAVHSLDSMFSLHGAMPNFAADYKSGQALVVHACASPYRDRSHFDGQDVLESGFATPGHIDSGWMNRLLQMLPKAQRVRPVQGLATGTTTPLTIRGPAEVLGWAPTALTLDDPDLLGRIQDLYRQSDPILSDTFEAALQTRKITAGFTAGSARGGPSDPEMMVAMATGTAQILAKTDGPRIAALAFEGWDTHTAEIPRLNRLLGGLDKALLAFKQTLGPAWKDTAILVITEFGRMVAINGTQGTDHGTGTTAFLTGGAVRGGRVIADWPGLKTPQLYQARDLKPTTDIRSIAKGVIMGLYDMPESILSETVFPDSASTPALTNLIA